MVITAATASLKSVWHKPGRWAKVVYEQKLETCIFYVKIYLKFKILIINNMTPESIPKKSASGKESESSPEPTPETEAKGSGNKSEATPENEPSSDDQEKAEAEIMVKYFEKNKKLLAAAEQRVQDKLIERGWKGKAADAYRWLGDKNLSKLFKGVDNKYAQIALRAVSLRTVVAIGLLGTGFAGGAAAGAAAGVGLAAMRGVGGSVVTYDIENAIGAILLQKQAKAVVEKESNLAESSPGSLNKLRKTKQEIEAFALKYNKKHLLESEEYKKIKETYIKGVREHIRRKLAAGKTYTGDIMREENLAMRAAEQKINKRDEIKRLTAGGAGFLAAILPVQNDVATSFFGNFADVAPSEISPLNNGAETILEIEKGMETQAGVVLPEGNLGADDSAPTTEEATKTASEKMVDIEHEIETQETAKTASESIGEIEKGMETQAGVVLPEGNLGADDSAPTTEEATKTASEKMVDIEHEIETQETAKTASESIGEIEKGMETQAGVVLPEGNLGADDSAPTTEEATKTASEKMVDIEHEIETQETAKTASESIGEIEKGMETQAGVVLPEGNLGADDSAPVPAETAISLEIPLYRVVAGDNVWNILSEQLGDQWTAEKKVEFLQKIESLPNSEKAAIIIDTFGITSGDLDVIQVGEEINLNAIKSFVTGGQEIGGVSYEAVDINPEMQSLSGSLADAWQEAGGDSGRLAGFLEAVQKHPQLLEELGLGRLINGSGEINISEVTVQELKNLDTVKWSQLMESYVKNGTLNNDELLSHESAPLTFGTPFTPDSGVPVEGAARPQLLTSTGDVAPSSAADLDDAYIFDGEIFSPEPATAPTAEGGLTAAQEGALDRALVESGNLLNLETISSLNTAGVIGTETVVSINGAEMPILDLKELRPGLLARMGETLYTDGRFVINANDGAMSVLTKVSFSELENIPAFLEANGSSREAIKSVLTALTIDKSAESSFSSSYLSKKVDALVDILAAKENWLGKVNINNTILSLKNGELELLVKL